MKIRTRITVFDTPDLDLYVDDIEPAHEEVTALGARLLKPVDPDAQHGFQVYADPSGHPFCLCLS